MPGSEGSASSLPAALSAGLRGGSGSSEDFNPLRAAYRLFDPTAKGHISAGDLQRGANFHVSALRRFVTLKHELSDDARALSIQLVYQLVTADIDGDVDLDLVTAAYGSNTVAWHSSECSMTQLPTGLLPVQRL